MRRYNTVDLMKERDTIANRIATSIDPEYRWYAGAPYAIARQIAVVDCMLKNKMIPKVIVPLAKLFRSYLDQQRKAYFASDGCSEITKLGFIEGQARIVKRATAPATY